MMGLTMPAFALALALALSASGPLEPTQRDVQEAIAAETYDPYAEGEILAWRRDLRTMLKRDNLNVASRALATKYGFADPDMRRLVRAWVIAQARQYDSDHAWVEPVRTELHTLVSKVRGKPLGIAIIAEALDATVEDCSADDFTALIQGSTNPAADGYLIATTSSCTGNFVRAAVAGGDRAVPALIRAAQYGGLPPRDTLPLYAWLTSPATLAHVREEDKFRVSAILWQRYLTALFDADMSVRGLNAYDSLPANLRAAVVSPDPRPRQVAVVDGIAMTLAAEGESSSTVLTDVLNDQTAPAGGTRAKALQAPPRDLSAIDAPILQLAEAMTIAGRDGEARALLATLPGLAQAKASAACQYARTSDTKSPCTDDRHLPMGALPLDHLLNEPDSDPYPIAETTLSGSGNFGRGAGSAILCRVFAAAEYADICPRPADADYFSSTSTNAEELTDAEASLDRLIPDLKALRQSLLGEHDSKTPAAGKTGRLILPTVAAVPPDFSEKPIPPEYIGAGRPTTLKGLAPLPNGFQLIRSERAGERVVAISVSQTYDPTGEVSQGGYWVHVSNDAGKHWERPLYTGLADRFPYVVVPASRLPLIVGDTLQLAVNVAEIDTASITYPPVALRSRRRADNRYLTIPLATLRQDSDGDGLTDVAAHHLLLDHPETASAAPFVLGSDYDADCWVAPSAEKLALVDLLGRMTGASGAAIVEPVDRPAGEVMTRLRSAAAADEQPVFLLGNPKDYSCLTSKRLIIVYDQANIEALKRFTPDFHALEVPPIVFNRAYDRGYVRWSTGWAGGTYRLWRVNGKWQFETISSWIT